MFSLSRCIPLYIDFNSIVTSYYYKIWTDFFHTEAIRKQAYSLKLTDQNRYQQQIFNVSCFFDGFVNLRSLSLIYINEHNIANFIASISKLPQLSSFDITRNSSYVHNKLLPQVLASQLPILTLPKLNSHGNFMSKFSSIVNSMIYMMYQHTQQN